MRTSKPNPPGGALGGPWRLGGFLGALGLLGALPAQHTLRTIEGGEHNGTLTGVAAGEVALATESGERRFPLDEVQEIDLGAATDTSERGADTLWLRSGVVLPASFTGATAEAARFGLPFSSTELAMPWRYVRAVRFDGDTRDPGFFAAIAKEPGRTDLLYARHDDGRVVRLSVTFVAIEDGSLQVEFSGNTQSMPLSKVYGLVFGEFSGAPPDPQPRPRARLTVSGDREIGGVLVGVDGQRCQLRLDEGITLDLPRPALRRILIESDRLVYLTDLEAEVDQTPALDRVWPPLRDRGPGGGKIRLGGRSYARGIVLFPRTRMTYRLDGSYDVLETTIGFEDGAGAQANAVFRVLSGDEVLFDSGPRPRDAEPELLSLPVRGLDAVTLEADFGEGLDLGDVCVFAAPRLLVK